MVQMGGRGCRARIGRDGMDMAREFGRLETRLCF
jgi:hypothetical protein